MLFLAGPDKGKTGYVIGMEGGTLVATKAIVKLETSSALGMREIKVRAAELFVRERKQRVRVRQRQRQRQETETEDSE